MNVFLIIALFPLAAAEERPAVTVAQPLRVELHEFDFLGLLSPAALVEVRAPVSGKVAKVIARAGDVVKKGEALLELDRAGFEREVEIAETTLKEKEYVLEVWDKKSMEKAETKEDQAVVDASRALAKVEVALARKRVDFFRSELEQTRVTAPISGQVTVMNVKPGDLVQAGVGASSLCRLMGADARVTFMVSASAWATLKALDKQVKMGLKDEKGFPHEGRIDVVESRAHPATGNMVLSALVANKDGALTPALLKPEKAPSVRVRLAEAKPRQTLVIPQRALNTDAKGGRFVLLVNGKDRIEQRTVKPGQPVGVFVAIDEGLTVADWVVVDQARLRPDSSKLSTDDFVEDLRLPFRAGTLVTPLREKLPSPF